MTETATVPCNGCTSCCRKEIVPLVEQDGDPARYRTVPYRGPDLGLFTHQLERLPNGDCVYLGEGGCTIYDRRPEVCRVFDCRGCVQQMGLAAAFMAAARGDPVIRAGLALTFAAGDDCDEA